MRELSDNPLGQNVFRDSQLGEGLPTMRQWFLHETHDVFVGAFITDIVGVQASYADGRYHRSSIYIPAIVKCFKGVNWNVQTKLDTIQKLNLLINQYMNTLYANCHGVTRE